MSETKIPELHDLPEIDFNHTHPMAQQLRSLYNPSDSGSPGYVVRHQEGIYDLPGANRAISVGARVSLALRELGVLNIEPSRETISPTTSSPHHLDGLDTGRAFAQIHANGKYGPRAGVEIEVRRLSPDVQAELHAHAADQMHARMYDSQYFLSDMPDAVSLYAPIVARYRVARGLGNLDAIVFRNGFDASRVSEKDKFLTTHKFWSMDDSGNPVEEERHASVSLMIVPSLEIKRESDPGKSRGILRRFKRK